MSAVVTLVTGGAASGKSEYAEELILKSGGYPRIYIATMKPWDEECLKRIERHRRMRAAKKFETVEKYTGLSKWSCPQGASILLECLSNLTANELFSEDGASAVLTVMEGIETIIRNAQTLVIVSNEVFSDGCSYGAETQHYIACLGEINRQTAALSHNVVEIVCRIPISHKNSL